MKVFIAKNVEQAKRYFEAIHASFLVLMEGRNDPTDDFGRPPAQPTLGYAKVFYARPVARFDGIAAGRRPDGEAPVTIVIGHRTDDFIMSDSRCFVDESRLPAVVEMVPFGSDLHGVPRWRIAGLDYPDGDISAPAATSDQEVIDVVALPEPSLDLQTDERDRIASISDIEPDDSPTTDEGLSD